MSLRDPLWMLALIRLRRQSARGGWSARDFTMDEPPVKVSAKASGTRPGLPVAVALTRPSKATEADSGSSADPVRALSRREFASTRISRPVVGQRSGQDAFTSAGSSWSK